MRIDGRRLALVGAGLLSSPCLAFAPGPAQIHAAQASVGSSSASFSSQKWAPTGRNHRRTPPQAPSRSVRRRPGVFVGLAAEAEERGAGGEGGGAKREPTQQDRVDEINKLVYVTETMSSSKMMTIDSFGPEQSASARRGAKSRTNNAAPSYAAQEPLLPQEIARQKRLYEKRKWRLIGDNVFLGLLGTSGAWVVSFKAACSYGLGATLGTAYLVLLSRFVENLGKDGQDGGGGGGGRGGGGGGGPARLALAGLLVLIVSKNKETFEFIPALGGFLAYQVATLVQGIYTDFDELEDTGAEAAG
eukprot:g8035.t1